MISILDVQKHAVICVSEGIVDIDGDILGSKIATHDPAGNIQYTGAAEAVKRLLVERIGDAYFTRQRRNESADAAIFVRKIGHTQRGGRPIKFDRFYASQLGGKAVELLLDGYHNCVATLQGRDGGFHLDSMDANKLRDRGGSSTPGRCRWPSTTRSVSSPRRRRRVLPIDVHQRPGGRRCREHPLDLQPRQPDASLRLGECPHPQADSPAPARGVRLDWRAIGEAGRRCQPLGTGDAFSKGPLAARVGSSPGDDRVPVASPAEVAPCVHQAGIRRPLIHGGSGRSPVLSPPDRTQRLRGVS